MKTVWSHHPSGLEATAATSWAECHRTCKSDATQLTCWWAEKPNVDAQQLQCSNLTAPAVQWPR